MKLCRLHDSFNGTLGLSFSQVLLESISEDGQLVALLGPETPGRSPVREVFSI